VAGGGAGHHTRGACAPQTAAIPSLCEDLGPSQIQGLFRVGVSLFSVDSGLMQPNPAGLSASNSWGGGVILRDLARLTAIERLLAIGFPRQNRADSATCKALGAPKHIVPGPTSRISRPVDSLSVTLRYYTHKDEHPSGILLFETPAGPPCQ
jgi:hypothetical protein